MSAGLVSAFEARIVRRKITGIRHLFRMNRQEQREKKLERIESLAW